MMDPEPRRRPEGMRMRSDFNCLEVDGATKSAICHAIDLGFKMATETYNFKTTYDCDTWKMLRSDLHEKKKQQRVNDVLEAWEVSCRWDEYREPDNGELDDGVSPF